ncbi:hypothetical protein ACEQUB_p00205 (plasmid) [Ralstonia syzygii]
MLGARSMPGNPYDGHTLAQALEQAEILSEVRLQIAIVDRGNRGVEVQGVKIYHPRLRRGITRGLRAMIRRRSVIEPAIGHMKADGKLDRNWLKGTLGDARGAVRCRPQPAHDPAEAAASLRLCSCEPLRFCHDDDMRPSSGENELFRGDYSEWRTRSCGCQGAGSVPAVWTSAAYAACARSDEGTIWRPHCFDGGAARDHQTRHGRRNPSSRPRQLHLPAFEYRAMRCWSRACSSSGVP